MLGEADQDQEPRGGGASDAPPAAPSEPSPVGAPPDPEVALDEDSPAQVRKTFIALMFAACAICLIPRQYASAAILFALGAVVTALHLRARRSGR